MQRYHDRIECDFILKYSISNEAKESIEIELKKKGDNIFFKAENYIEDPLLLQWSPYNSKNKPYGFQLIPESYVTYEEIKCFLPKNIITSVFLLHGEYPIERTRNYLVHNILEIYYI